MPSEMLTKEEFYKELRASEQRAQEKLDKSHLSLSNVLSDNIGAIQKSVKKGEDTLKEVKDTLKTHMEKEEAHQDKMEKMLANIDMDDLRDATVTFRNAQGFKVIIFGIAKWIAILGAIGGAIVWLFDRLRI